jgi:hypothetical protein
MESAPEAPSLEHSRGARNCEPGRGRRLFLALAVGSIASLVIWIVGIRRVDGLPDVGDPFNVAEAQRPIVIPDADNAYVLYAQARPRPFPLPAAVSHVDFDTLTWSTAGDNVRAFAAEKRPALELWRQGSERPDAIFHQPGELALDTILPLASDVRFFATLAALEGSRHEEKGAMDQAWTWYRAMLRSSRHVGKRGVIIERMVGANMHNKAARHILHWAADRRVDAKLLRQALDDTLAADALTPPLSDNLKLEYLMHMRDMDELRVMITEVPMPGGRFGWFEQMIKATGLKAPIQRFRLQATNDVERSRRVTRLLFANWLAQIDRPASNRAPIAIQKPVLIYAFDPTTPFDARAIEPAILDGALDHTALAREMFHPEEPVGTRRTLTPWEGSGFLAREPKRRAVLIVKLAAELYRREQKQPPATAAALLGSYLKVLPEGIARDDPIPSGLD